MDLLIELFPISLTQLLRNGELNLSGELRKVVVEKMVVVSDGTHCLSVRAAQFQPFPYPVQLAGGMRPSAMQTVRVPLRVFADAGVNIRRIRQIAFLFDQPVRG